MSSRRIINTTEESAYSVGSSVMRDAELAQQFLAATELEQMPEHTVLNRSLTVKSVISTSSSFARRFQSARNRPELQEIIQIGAGLQGAIFEQVGKPLVLKKEKPGNETLPSNLRHEYQMHHDVATAFAYYDPSMIESGVHVPRLFDLLLKTENDLFWNEILPKFPAAYRSRSDLVKMERILPLPKVVRKALVTHFYPQQQPLDSAAINMVLNNPENKHCLARTYLGKSVGAITQDKFSLRNFPLYLTSMEDLGMDVEGLANCMGKAYAIMHWGAGVNGDDVEFVLGTSAVQGEGGDATASNFQHRAVGFYLLDFGQCDSVDLTEDADMVYQAFKGAMVTGDNQLFIPHFERSPKLFAAFKEGYAEAGRVILADKKLEDKFSMADFMQEYQEYAEDFL